MKIFCPLHPEQFFHNFTAGIFLLCCPGAYQIIYEIAMVFWSLVEVENNKRFVEEVKEKVMEKVTEWSIKSEQKSEV